MGTLQTLFILGVSAFTIVWLISMIRYYIDGR